MWWTLSSGIKTKSPTTKLWRGLIYFCHLGIEPAGIIRRILVLNTSARYWTCFQRRWHYKLFLTKTPGGKFKCNRSNKWIVVRFRIIGLYAIVDSRWSTIKNSLNFCHQRLQCLTRTTCCLKRTLTFLTKWIMLSQTPPMCDTSGKLNFHLMFIRCRKTSIFYWFQLFRASRISLSGLLMFIPLLPLIIFGVPLLLMNLQRAQINESVSRDSVTSKWIARIVTAAFSLNDFFLFTSLITLLSFYTHIFLIVSAFLSFTVICILLDFFA